MADTSNGADTSHEPGDHTLQLDDGRTLGYRTIGLPQGPAVLVFHGTPGSRLSWDFLHDAAVELGVRVIAPDRPGIGSSDDQPNRGILDWPADMATLADHLHLDTFSVVGWSGGAPYALACAITLPERVTAVGIVSGISPLDREGAYEGMGRSERNALQLTHKAVWLAGPMYRGLRELIRFQPWMARRLIETSLPPRDRAEFEARGSAADALAYLREALRQGPRGVVIDYRLFTFPWGFELTQVGVPTHVFHGEDDRSIPPHHATEFATRIPGATLTIWAKGGHLAVVDHGIELLRAVTT